MSSSVAARLLAASVVVGVPALLVAVTIVLAVRTLRRPAGDLGRTARLARRHAVVIHVVAWLVALTVYPVLAFDLIPGTHDLARRYGTALGGQAAVGDGVVLGLAPAGVGLAFLLVHVVGELTWPRPTGRVRSATLRPRRVADVAPRGMRRLTRAWFGAFVTTAVLGGLTAAPDGRSISLERAGWAASSGPYPGWFYGVPLLVAATVVLLGQEAVLRLVTRRPAVSDAAEDWDLGLRRLSAHRILRGTQLVLGITTGAVLVVAGLALQSLDDPYGRGHAVVGTVALVVGSVAVLAACALTLRQGPVPQAPGTRPGGAGPGGPGGPDPQPAPVPTGPRDGVRSSTATLDRPSS